MSTEDSRKKRREYMAQWYTKNKDKVKKWTAEYRTLNPTVARKSRQKWEEANPSNKKIRRKAWVIKNPGYQSWSAICRKKKIVVATPKWCNIEAVKQIYINRPTGYCVDHIIPLKGINPITKLHVVCGLHVENNLRYLPWKENASKWAWFTP